MSKRKFDVNEEKVEKQYGFIKLLDMFACSSILILSCVVVGAALIVRENLSKYDEFLYYYGSAATLCVILGSIISIFVPLWGYYAIYKECLIQLFSFTAALGTILLIHATISILFVSYLRAWLLTSIGKLLDENMLSYKDNPGPMDLIQTNLKCCGKYDAADWFKYLPYLPASCCPEKMNNTIEFCQIGDYLVMNHNGCLENLEHLPQTSTDIIIMLIVGLEISEILTMLVNMLLCWMLMTYRNKTFSENGKSIT